MKKIIICVAMLITATAFNITNAQSRASMNVNIGAQPVWGPIGYDYVQYYYLPDVESYYYVPTRQFVHYNGERWIHSNSLPVRYKTYDLNTGYKVVVNEPKAYLHFDRDKAKFISYRNNHSQVIIRNSDDPRYYVVKGHPKYKVKSNNGKHLGQKKHGKF